jgi:hypothetical protein
MQGMFSGQNRKEWGGTVINLSKEGCLIETDGQVYAGMQMSLRFNVTGEPSPIVVAQAGVRWNRGRKVGIGFITMIPADRQRLDQVIERLKKGTAVG